MNLVDQHPDMVVERYLESDVFDAISLINSRFPTLEAVIARFEAIDKFNDLGNVEYYGASTAFAGLSTTSVTMPLVGGTVSFTVLPVTGVDVCLFLQGMPVRCYATSSAYFTGVVESYSAEGVVTVKADTVEGSGTYASWAIMAVGSRGLTGAKGEAGWSSDAGNVITTGSDGKALLTAAAIAGFAKRSTIIVTAANTPSMSQLPDSLFAYTQGYTASTGFTVIGCPLTAVGCSSAQYEWLPNSSITKTGTVRWTFIKGAITTVYRASVTNGAFTSPFVLDSHNFSDCPSYALNARDFISDFTGTAGVSVGLTSALVAAAACGKPLWFPSSSTLLLDARVAVTLSAGSRLLVEGNGVVLKYAASLSLAASSALGVVGINGVCDSISFSDVVFSPISDSSASFAFAIGNSDVAFNTGFVKLTNISVVTDVCKYNVVVLRNCSNVSVSQCSLRFTELRFYCSVIGADYVVKSSVVGMLRGYVGTLVRLQRFKVVDCVFKDHPLQPTTDYSLRVFFVVFSRLNANTAISYLSDVEFESCEFDGTASPYATLEGLFVTGQDMQVSRIRVMRSSFTALTGRLVYVSPHIPSSVVTDSLATIGAELSDLVVRSHRTIVTSAPPIRLQGCTSPIVRSVVFRGCTGSSGITEFTAPPLISIGSCFAPIIENIRLSGCTGYSRSVFLDACLLSVLQDIAAVDSPTMSTVPHLSGGSTVSGGYNAFLVNARTNTGAVVAATEASAKVLPADSTNQVTFIDGSSPQLFDAASGIYTVPVSGVYSFALVGVAQTFNSPSENFAFIVNDVVTGATTRCGFNSVTPFVLTLTKFLYAGDKVGIKFLGRDEVESRWRIVKYPPVGILAPSGLHFTGYRLGDTYALPDV